jgi:hypothetical protein
MNNEENNNVNPFSPMDNNNVNSDTSTPVSAFDNVTPVVDNSVVNNNVETAHVQNTVEPTVQEVVQPEVSAEPTIELTPSDNLSSEAAVVNNQSEVAPSVEPIQSVNTSDAIQSPFKDAPEESISFDGPKKKNPAIKIIIAVVALIILAVVGFYCYTSFVLVTGKNVVKTSITKVYDSVISSIDKAEKKMLVIDPSKDIVGVSGNINFGSNYKDDNIDLTNLSKYTIKYDSAFDLSKESMFITAILDKEGSDLIDGNILLKNNKLTIGSNKLSLYSYQTSMPSSMNFEFKQSVTLNDVKKLIEKAKVATLNNIDEKSITKASGKRQDKNYTKVTYEMNMSKMTKDIINAYINDNEAIEILSRLTTLSKEDVTNKLKDELENLDESKNIYADIYVDNLFGNFVGMTLRNTEGKETIEIDNIDGNYQFSMKGDSSYTFKGNYMSDTKTLNVYYNDDKYSIELSIKEVSDSKINVSFNAGDKNNKLSVDMDIDNVVSGNKQTIKLDAKVKVVADDENIDFNVNGETNIVKGAEVKDNSSMFVKDINEMTQEELYEIQNKASEVLYSVMYDFMPAMSLNQIDYSQDLSM